jgi:acyl-coenzyme A thioesterase PaaI-like protein
MHVPGTGHLRTAILATWADTIAGLLAADVMDPRVPVTLDLDVHLYGPAPGAGIVHGLCKTVKSGRSVFVARVDFTDESGGPIAFGAASFMAAPDETLRIPGRTSLDEVLPVGTRLTVPFAERAGCERRGPGVAVLANSDESLNSSNTLNGGLIALAVEEAVLSLSDGATLSSLGMRYLQPIRIGPAVADAQVQDGLGRVDVRDASNDNRLCVMATSRIFCPPQLRLPVR